MPSSNLRNVIMVTNNALEDKVGGHERYVRELASTLSRRGLDVTIVAKRLHADSTPRATCDDGVTIERYAVPSKRNPVYALAFLPYVAAGVLARVRRRVPGTVVHAHMGLQALPLALTQTPFLFTFHAPVWRELLSERQGTYVLPATVQASAVRTLRAAERYVARHAATVVVLSEFMRGELALLDRQVAEGAAVVPGGIDTERFSPAENGAREGADGPFSLFTARRLTPRTGVDELIRAMPPILASHPGVRLSVAGIGPMEQELRRLVADLGLGHAVELLGRISDQELVDRYRRATLVVLPTRELEGFGLTTAEALACGAAVVGTPAGATPELLAPLDPGLMTADTSAAAIATTVDGLLSQPDRLESIRSRARMRVAPAMSWDRVADHYMELYERASLRP